jgi:two-component system, cell cycle response regulator DivK
MTVAKTVLHIEDNSDNRLLVRRLLTAYGYTVVEAENAVQAREILAVQPPNLILMDINLPGVDGYALTAEIKSAANLRDIPIIAITANVMKGDRERTISAGCDGYIEKPIDVDHLVEMIDRYLSRSSSG